MTRRASSSSLLVLLLLLLSAAAIVESAVLRDSDGYQQEADVFANRAHFPELPFLKCILFPELCGKKPEHTGNRHLSSDVCPVPTNYLEFVESQKSKCTTPEIDNLFEACLHPSTDHGRKFGIFDGIQKTVEAFVKFLEEANNCVKEVYSKPAIIRDSGRSHFVEDTEHRQLNKGIFGMSNATWEAIACLVSNNNNKNCSTILCEYGLKEYCKEDTTFQEHRQFFALPLTIASVLCQLDPKCNPSNPQQSPFGLSHEQIEHIAETLRGEQNRQLANEFEAEHRQLDLDLGNIDPNVLFEIYRKVVCVATPEAEICKKKPQGQ